MRKRIIGGVWAASLTSFGLATAQPDTNKPDFEGLWINEAGSAVTLDISETGHLSGTYQTELGQPDAQSQFAVTGWVQGDVLAFSVRFDGYGSITSWSGQLSEDEEGPFIRTLWHYTKDIPDSAEADDLWRTINAGSALFRRPEANRD